MVTPATRPTPDPALRAEHDELAARLAARRSIDAVRRGAYSGFALAITVGLSIKLAWDRWGSRHPKAFKGPPVFFYLAAAVAAVLLVVTVSAFVRARRLMAREDVDFERLRRLRAELGIDA
jgi:hypothetical protein